MLTGAAPHSGGGGNHQGGGLSHHGSAAAPAPELVFSLTRVPICSDSRLLAADCDTVPDRVATKRAEVPVVAGPLVPPSSGTVLLSMW